MRGVLVILALWGLGCSDGPKEAPPERSAAPQRIISLAPNLTEVMMEIGLGDRIIAVTRYDRDAIDGRALKRVGGIVDPSVEQMVALNPDLVLLHRDGPPPIFVVQLESVGIPVYSCGIKTLSALKSCVMGLGQRLEAVEATDKLMRSMSPLFEAPTALNEESPTIMLVLNESPLIAATRDSFPAQVARLAGWRPLPDGRGPDYPRLSLEQMAALKPDLTVDLVMGRDHNHEAFKERLLQIIDLPQVAHIDPDLMVRPGPRLILGLEALRELNQEAAP